MKVYQKLSDQTVRSANSRFGLVTRFLAREESSLLVFLILLIVLFSLLQPSFLTVNNGVNVIRQVTIL